MATDNLRDLELFADAAARAGNEKVLKELIQYAGTLVKKKNTDRIRANIQPDGTKMRRRKDPQKGNAHIAFIYKNPVTGMCLVRNLKNWRDNGDYIKGFDRMRGAMRSFRRSRIVKYISIDKSKVVVRNAPQKMFKNIIKAKWFKLKAKERSATIEFAGVAGTVAAIHHYGEKDRPNPKAKEIRYPERQLLGVTNADTKEIWDFFIDRITKEFY
ncbi:TPA: phage virion morphogenesis protein [Aeromonas hydrophila]|uniref:phage virion morphogenesis protein n=1 Tax=Aeromonas hydrophila TaxID=644 RepID=UPI0009BA0EC4|nr:phage virion morphogenesis protein [Aeromonas hydrophila]HAU4886198.1 phage virion morphogenesis protein [Aeromonas hydrophila]